MIYRSLNVKVKLSSLKGSLLAIIILVFGNYFRMSSEAFDGEIYGLSVTEISTKDLLPEYDSRHIFKNG